MCGRYVTRNEAAIERYLNLIKVRNPLTDRFNVAPTQDVPVVRLIDGERVMSNMHWGLIPFWAKDKKIGYKTINARAETVAIKPAFRSAYKVRRCLIPASGFYEWKRDTEPKTPHFIFKQDDEPIGFAGLWETWKREDETLESCSIVTTEANDMMAELHNRMPVILDAQDFDWWMEGDVREVGQLLKPCPVEWLDAYPISRQVNNARNQGPELIERLAA